MMTKLALCVTVITCRFDLAAPKAQPAHRTPTPDRGFAQASADGCVVWLAFLISGVDLDNRGEKDLTAAIIELAAGEAASTGRAA